MRPLLPTGLLFATFAGLNRILLCPCVLVEESYRKPVVVVAAIANWDISPRLLVIVALAALLLARWRSVWVRWVEVDPGGRIRAISFACAGVLGWMYSTYAWNHYLGVGHWVDRLLLGSLAIAIFWRPVFVFPFLFTLWPLLGQFQIPLGGFSWAVAYLPARILLLLATLFLWGIVRRQWYCAEFWFLLLCLVAGHYFTPGLGKLKNGWLVYDHIYYLLPNTYANGWLGFLSETRISQITRLLSVANVPMKLFAAVAEMGAIAFVWRHGISKLFLVAWVLFHVGVLALSGICFWPWIIIDLTLLVLIWKRHLLAEHQQDRVHQIASLLLIGSAYWWSGAVNLSWIDSPATYTYRVVGISEEGQEYEVPPHALTPFEYQFMLGDLHYVADHPGLNITWGATDRTTFSRLRDVTSGAELVEVERKFGKRQGNEERVQRLREFFLAYSRSPVEDAKALGFLRAPSILWAFPSGQIYDGRVALDRIRIDRILTAFLDGEYQEVRAEQVLSIDIE